MPNCSECEMPLSSNGGCYYPECNKPDRPYIDDAEKMLKPLIDAIKAMPVEDMVRAMQGFYDATDDNCSWFVFGMKHTMPGMIAIIANMEKDRAKAYEAAWATFQQDKASHGSN